jgi:hypothetical protein
MIFKLKATPKETSLASSLRNIDRKKPFIWSIFLSFNGFITKKFEEGRNLQQMLLTNLF